MKKNNARPPGKAVFSSPEDCRKKLEAYFLNCAEQTGEVPDVEGLAVWLKTTREKLKALLSDSTYGFELQKAYDRIAAVKKQNAFQGELPAAVLVLDLKNNHGYRDKPEDTQVHETVVFKGNIESWSE